MRDRPICLFGEVPDRPRPVDLARGVPLVGLELLVEFGLGGDLDREIAMEGRMRVVHLIVLQIRSTGITPRATEPTAKIALRQGWSAAR